MTAWDGNLDEQEPDTSLHQRVCRATFFLGITVRHTVDFIRIPFQFIANSVSGYKTGTGTSATSSRRGRITSKLSRMNSRLQSIEQSLSISGGNTNPNTSRYFTRQSVIQKGEVPEGDSKNLIEALVDPDQGVRRFALGSIGSHADEDITLLIIDSLNDPEPDVRRAAVAATGKANITSAVFSLILLLNDPAEQVVEEAKLAIEKITGRKVKIGPKTSASSRQKSIDKLKEWWKKERFANLSRDVKTAIS